MSKQKIWSDFNHLECGKTEKKKFAGTWSFNKRLEISSVERMVLLHFRLSPPFIRLNVSKLMLILPEV